MLYISGFVDAHTLFLTDTNSGVRQAYSCDSIVYLLNYGVEVLGARLEDDMLSYHFYPYAKDVEQTKLLLAKGYVYDVREGHLYSLVVDRDLDDAIVLGDFCSSVGSYCLCSNARKPVELVIDKRIRYIADDAFPCEHKLYYSMNPNWRVIR